MPLFSLFSKNQQPAKEESVVTPEKITGPEGFSVEEALGQAKQIVPITKEMLSGKSTAELETLQSDLMTIKSKITKAIDVDTTALVRTINDNIEKINFEITKKEKEGVSVTELDDSTTLQEYFPQTDKHEPKTANQALALEALKDLEIDLEGSRVIYEKLAGEAIRGNKQSLERLLDHKEALLKEIAEVNNNPSLATEANLKNLLSSLEAKRVSLQTALDKYQSLEGVAPGTPTVEDEAVAEAGEASNDSSLVEKRAA